jgi:hypothetical protein
MSFAVGLLNRIGPALALTVVGVFLFRRYRSLASALVVLGFGANVVGGIVYGLAAYYASYIYSSTGTLAGADLAHGTAWTAARFCMSVGAWVASLSLLWQVMKLPDSASPNNRLRGP